MNHQSVREAICEVGHHLWTLGFVAANDGNISVKLEDGTFLTTPTGISKRALKPHMLLHMNANNEVIERHPEYLPSSEFKMHLRCYKERPDINAVVHAHPPTATGFALAHIPLDEYSMPEAIMFLGSVPIAPYATPGTDEVPESLVPYLPYHDTILLMNHGAVTVGVDLTQAYYRMETLEHFAKATLVARQLGGAKELPPDKIQECCDLAKKYPIRHPGYRKYSK
jgi:L-fuculose-phosphate aldolase